MKKTGACKIGGVGLVHSCELLGVEVDVLSKVLSSRHIKTAKESYDVPNNLLQCNQTRNALAKAIYARTFDYVVKRINVAIAPPESDSSGGGGGGGVGEEDTLLPYSIGVLDIYGFEVFEINGFEQFCINFINEKLQQIFIELTLKNEQEEYAREGIKWQPIPFFNNKIVCELIEGSLPGTKGPRLPPGIFSLLDDICSTMHSESSGADRSFAEKVSSIHSSHPHLLPGGSGGTKFSFIVRHFAGEVSYRAEDFPSKNADELGNELILAMQTSTKKLLSLLFNDSIDLDNKKRGPTAGSKIRAQTKNLVNKLMSSQPHYIRTIKSNDVKKSNFFDQPRVLFQCKYLGLLENLKVRRAGFAYRREFHSFVSRFALLSSKTWPHDFSGSDRDAAKAILKSVKVMSPSLVDSTNCQLGKSMIFIKDPEIIASLDQLKGERLGSMFTKFQRLWRNYKKNKEAVAIKNAMALFLYKGNKERRRESFYRPFHGIYFEKWRKEVGLMNILHQFEPKHCLNVVFIDRIAVITSTVNPTPMQASYTNTFPSLFEHSLSFTENSTVLQHWKREELLFVITKENIFIIQETNRANGNGAAGSSSSSAARGSPPPLDRSKSPQAGVSSAAASAPGGFVSYVPAYFLRRVIPLPAVASLSLSTLADPYLALHVHPAEMTRTVAPPAWVADADAKHCGECGEGFGLFFRRSHCRCCGHIYCRSCLVRTAFLPDFGGNFLRSPERLCAFCFGVQGNADFSSDVFFASDKRTEILHTLQQLFACSPLKSLTVDFTSSVTLKLREHSADAIAPILVERHITFVKGKASKLQGRMHSLHKFHQSSSGSSGGAACVAFDVTPQSATAAEVRVQEGLAPHFIKSCQKRAAKRRAAADQRKAAEREERQRRAAQREEQREAERKERLKEKKRMKAEAKAAAEQEAQGSNASNGAMVKFRPSSSRGASAVSAAAAAPAVPPCGTCGCTSFTAHMFKKGLCSGCSHKHV